MELPVYVKVVVISFSVVGWFSGLVIPPVVSINEEVVSVFVGAMLESVNSKMTLIKEVKKKKRSKSKHG